VTRRRGGPQEIPRPPGTRAGGPAPWYDLPQEQRALTLDLVRQRLGASGEPNPASIEFDGARFNAVLAPLYVADDGGVHVVLTRRAWHMRSHTGEVSFPGGGYEEGDDHLASTALREAEEEIGLIPADVEIIGELDHLATFVSRNAIVPYVGVVDGLPELKADHTEVDQILHVPLSELLAPDVFREELWGRGDRWVRMFFFELYGDTVWGATASMLRQLLTIAVGLGREAARWDPVAELGENADDSGP
jgi:8-oxo-dGTP pyrophosphatase MutT (NUDIX family)